MSETTSDRIEKTIVLRASRARVWRALTDAQEFGAWFRVKLEGSFEIGQRARGHILYPGYEHVTMEMLIERMDAERLFAFRWHPYAIDPAIDYRSEPMTLVEFRLEDAAGGTRLTVTESGFDRIPAARRDEAFRMNTDGWAGQVENIRAHVEG
ncbi:MAG: SRPBCC family protein [Kofleriaceae bacterium]